MSTLSDLTWHESGGLRHNQPFDFTRIESCIESVSSHIRSFHGRESSCIMGFDSNNDLSILLRIIKCGCCSDLTYDYYDFSGHKRSLAYVFGLEP